MSYFHKGNRMPLHRNANTPPPKPVYFMVFIYPQVVHSVVFTTIFFVSVVSICTTVTEKSPVTLTLSPTHPGLGFLPRSLSSYDTPPAAWLRRSGGGSLAAAAAERWRRQGGDGGGSMAAAAAARRRWQLAVSVAAGSGGGSKAAAAAAAAWLRRSGGGSLSAA